MSWPLPKLSGRSPSIAFANQNEMPAALRDFPDTGCRKKKIPKKPLLLPDRSSMLQGTRHVVAKSRDYYKWGCLIQDWFLNRKPALTPRIALVLRNEIDFLSIAAKSGALLAEAIAARKIVLRNTERWSVLSIILFFNSTSSRDQDGGSCFSGGALLKCALDNKLNCLLAKPKHPPNFVRLSQACPRLLNQSGGYVLGVGEAQVCETHNQGIGLSNHNMSGDFTSWTLPGSILGTLTPVCSITRKFRSEVS